MHARVTIDDRTAFFALSCRPISAAAEREMESISHTVSGEALASQWAPGAYQCARCAHVLYDAGDKFEGPCLWPSFRAPARPGGCVTELAVPAGEYNEYQCDVRELYCAACDLFVGHMFADGRETDTHPNAHWRHCVLTLSLRFMPQGERAH